MSSIWWYIFEKIDKVKFKLNEKQVLQNLPDTFSADTQYQISLYYTK